MVETVIQYKSQRTRQKSHKCSSTALVLTVSPSLFPIGNPKAWESQCFRQAFDLRLIYDQTGKSQAAPLTSWLRVPLSWYSSHTISFFPDETHTSIRRTYTSPSQPESKRYFCGFCGTPLSYWTESPSSEASYIALTLGSLTTEDLRDLEELGLLPEEAVADAETDKQAIGSVGPRAGGQLLDDDVSEGLPWFDTMVQGSALGKVRRHGERREGKGWRVEWEIVEWTDGDEEAPGIPSVGGKRKLGDVAADSEDIGME